jgi:hypothetical protein
LRVVAAGGSLATTALARLTGFAVLVVPTLLALPLDAILLGVRAAVVIVSAAWIIWLAANQSHRHRAQAK